MNLVGWIVIGVIVLLLLWAVGIYNRLVRLRALVKEGFSGITVQLRRRADLIRLATADEQARIGAITPATDARDRNGARRKRELLELLDIFGVRGCADAEAHEHRPFT